MVGTVTCEIRCVCKEKCLKKKVGGRDIYIQRIVCFMAENFVRIKLKMMTFTSISFVW